MKSGKKIVERANAAFETSERSNFKTRWDSAVALCRPAEDSVLGESTKGGRKGLERLIDTGVTSLDIFTSGITSTLIPQGSRFFQYEVAKGKSSDELKRWLSECSRITLDYIQETNFFTEATKSFNDLGLIGTSLMMTEPDPEAGLRFKTFFINKFAFLEDYKGHVDSVFFKLKMTNRQIEQQFGAEALTTRQQGKEDEEKTVIHAIYPRTEGFRKDSLNPKHHKYASMYIMEDTGKIVKESGFSEMPAAVCRWFQASNELYGRSPATQCAGSLSMANVMERTKLKSAQRIASPQWIIADDGSTRNLNNTPGGIVYYNASNPAAKPEQLNVRDMPNITHEYQAEKKREIEDAFYVSIFNPMSNVTGNTTASEIDQRVSIAKMALVPKITRVIDELLNPTFKRVFKILFDSGRFPEAPPKFDYDKVKVRFISSAGLIIRQLENAGTLQTVEIVGMLAQIDPSAVDFINIDEVVKSTSYANSVPTEILRSDYEVGQIRAQRAEAQQAQAEAEQQQAMAAAYQQTSAAPEGGSPAEALMQDLR